MINPSPPVSKAPFLAPQAVKVTHVRRESHDTTSLTLNLPSSYPSWLPGQFNMLYLFGLGEVPISICGEHAGINYIVHTIKAVGAVTQALTHLKEGHTVWLRGPFGSSWPPLPEQGTALLVAGGIGIAPLRPIILAALNKKTPLQVILLYGARTPADVLFADDLSQWQMHSKFSVYVTVDRLEGKESWTGAVGVVTPLIHQLDLTPETIVMACGPEIMMRHVVSDLASRGINDQKIYVSLERNMKCAIGLCGRCQWGAHFICRDGPVYRLADIRRFWTIKDF